ncbi:MAG: hypothetical protein HKM93_08760 [Desulfobacteraceae bacterium]|nr:hypothetical protein [Desulfobacteraceae bacterium]
MTFLIWICYLLGGGLVVLMVVPVRISTRGFFQDQGGWDYGWCVDWGMGVLSLKGALGESSCLYFLSFPIWWLRVGAQNRKKRDRKPSTPRKQPRVVFQWGAGNFGLLLSILTRFIRACGPRGHIKGQIGLDDPEHTAAVHFMANLLRQQTARFTENFTWALTSRYDEEIVDLRFHLRIRVVPGYLILIALQFLLKREIRLMWRSFPKNTARA